MRALDRRSSLKDYGRAFLSEMTGRGLCSGLGSWTRVPGMAKRIECRESSAMMKTEKFPIASIYVPTLRRTTLDPKKVDEIAVSMLEKGQQTPILVRPDGERFVLVEGLHRLEACKKLGDVTIVGYRVQARRH
jgi:sulfiredoxin